MALSINITVTGFLFFLYCDTLSFPSYNLNEFGQLQLHEVQITYRNRKYRNRKIYVPMY